MRRTRSGFTLIELSIVLVIIGIVVGTVLVGTSLIQAGHVRTLAAEFTTFKSAAYAFRDKYGALPGDFGRATSIWGVRTGATNSTGSDLACVSVLNTSSGTCNGVEDGLLNNYAGKWPSYGISERFLFWQHLALAGMITGQFSGAYHASTQAESPQGTPLPNSPVSSFPGAYWTAALNLNTVLFDDLTYTGNSLYPRSYSGNYALLTPAQALQLDLKIDDGRPGGGAAMAERASSALMPNCTTTNSYTTAEYNLGLSSAVCSLRFKLD